MSVGEIMSYLTFLFIGVFGIYASIKETNYMILIGSIGIIAVIISSIIDTIVDKKRRNTD